MSVPLEVLLRGPHLWRGDSQAEVAVPSVPTGHAALDHLLPGGGWPRGALTELLVTHPGIGELSLLMPALARLSRHDRWIALMAPPHLPYAPALAAAGVDLARLVIVRTKDGADTLWAMEQALASGACGAVVGWPSFVSERSLRRLQLAAETGRAPGIYFSGSQATSSSLAALRLQLSPAAEGLLGVKVLKVRGRATGSTLVLDTRPATTQPRNRRPGFPHPQLLSRREKGAGDLPPGGRKAQETSLSSGGRKAQETSLSPRERDRG